MVQLTRYLYELSEVKACLLLCLLNKDLDGLHFWLFEMYYSGLQYDCINFVIEIYYQFYYAINPSFEKYLFIKLKEITDETEEEKLVIFAKQMLHNLLLLSLIHI